MGGAGGSLSQVNEGMPRGFAGALAIINEMVADGVIDSYAVGGSVAIICYSEPFDTQDVDIFCYLPNQGRTDLLNLGTVWEYLQKRGYKSQGLYIVVEGVPIRFLSPGPTNDLESEAMETAVMSEVAGVPFRVFQLEYAMAIKIKAGRSKDWTHVSTALESANPDISKLESILERHGLLAKWKKWGELFNELR